MSLTTELRETQAAGECVCDFDVACVVHPPTGCGWCEFACHCVEHQYFAADCDCSVADASRTIDRDNTRNALAKHANGDIYVVTQASVWDDEQCVGSAIVRSVGPIRAGEIDFGSRDLYDTVDRIALNATSEDADWIQSEEDAGRLTYPWGARV